jgi:hypothetical protein
MVGLRKYAEPIPRRIGQGKVRKKPREEPVPALFDIHMH